MKEYLYDYQIWSYILLMISSIVITLISIPSIIHVANLHSLYDIASDTRKKHKNGIPRLGGIAIFVSFTITLLLFCKVDTVIPVKYLLASCIIMFAMGVKDDLCGINAGTKICIQFVAAFILVVPGDIRLSSMHGILNVYELSYIPGATLSIMFIILITNAFNLIDGVDGLAATTGIIVNGTFSILFIYMHEFELAAVSLTMIGAIFGFLKFNFSPAKIFMGDTGSLLIGIISAVMAIKFMELNQADINKTPQIYAVPAVALAILIGPVSDTLRVFTIRLSNGKSPFIADRNHIHHRMLKLGFNHMQTTVILASTNLLTIAFAIIFVNFGDLVIIGCTVTVSLIFNWMLTYFIRSRARESYALRNFFI